LALFPYPLDGVNTLATPLTPMTAHDLSRAVFPVKSGVKFANLDLLILSLINIVNHAQFQFYF